MTVFSPRHDDEIALVLMIHTDTDDAVFVSADGLRSTAVWLPKSACDFEDPIVYGRAQIIVVQAWIARKRGLV